MSFTEFGGVEELFWLTRKANPTIPGNIDANTCYFPKLVAVEELATVTIAGKYGSGVRGYRELDYTRLDLAKLFKGGPFKVGILEPKPLYDLFGDIYEHTGFRFDVTDLEPVVPPQGQTLPWRVKLKAARTSFIYYGEVEIEFVERRKYLSEVVLSKEQSLVLEGAVHTAARQRAELMTFGVDYTNKATELTSVATGVLDLAKATSLKDVLNEIDQLPWVANASSIAWNLNGAKVVFNGRVKDFTPTWWNANDVRRPNGRYDRVLVIDFIANNTGATGFYGSCMFIHYNSPLDNEVLNGNS